MTAESERTVLEAKSARSTLESKILRAVKEFEAETGMTVHAISINRVHMRQFGVGPTVSSFVHEVVAEVRL